VRSRTVSALSRLRKRTEDQQHRCRGEATALLPSAVFGLVKTAQRAQRAKREVLLYRIAHGEVRSHGGPENANTTDDHGSEATPALLQVKTACTSPWVWAA
jgi:hypothetical protein